MRGGFPEAGAYVGAGEWIKQEAALDNPLPTLQNRSPHQSAEILSIGRNYTIGLNSMRAITI